MIPQDQPLRLGDSVGFSRGRRLTISLFLIHADTLIQAITYTWLIED